MSRALPVSEFNDSRADYGAQFTDFVRQYLNVISTNPDFFSDNKSAIISTSDIMLKQWSNSFAEWGSIIKGNNNVDINTGVQTSQLLKSFMSSPSVANSTLKLLSKYISPSSAKFDDEKTKLSTQLFSSNIVKFINSCDIINTYISCMFMLLKQTSIYDVDKDKDHAYNTKENDVNPFLSY